MNEVQGLCKKYDYKYIETASEGFENMVRRKKAFPQCQRMQFCTGVLKMEPTLKLLREIDPQKKAVIYAGVRREESVKRRNHPYEIIFNEKYEGRLQRFPLVAYAEKERDFLVDEAGLDILLHSSMECFPCVCSNRSDLRLLARDPERVGRISALEKEMGYTGKGKPIVMFRPYRHMGAVGVADVIEWAKSERGKYKK